MGKQSSTWSVQVKRVKGGDWAIVFVTGAGTQHLIADGFFTRGAAELAAEQARKDALDASGKA